MYVHQHATLYYVSELVTPTRVRSYCTKIAYSDTVGKAHHPLLLATSHPIGGNFLRYV